MLILQKGFRTYNEARYQTTHIVNAPEDVTPSDISSMPNIDFLDPQHGVILPAIPAWFTSCLCTKLAFLPWIAVADRRFGAVVVFSKDNNYSVGQIIPLDPLNNQR